MKILLTVLSFALLAACGIETATTAASVAEMKRREMEQAKKDMEQAKRKIEATTQLMQERAADADKSKE